MITLIKYLYDLYMQLNVYTSVTSGSILSRFKTSNDESKNLMKTVNRRVSAESKAKDQ